MNDSGASIRNEALSPRRSPFLLVMGFSVGVMLAVAGAVLLGFWMRFERPESWYLRGRAAIDAGNPETARRLADKLIQTPGFEPHGQLLRGLLLARSGMFREALVLLEQASRHESTAVEASSAAARGLYSSGRFLETISAAHAALQLDPRCLDAMRWLAAAYYDLGAVSNAVVELEKLKTRAPADPRPDRLLGLIAKDGENFLEAIGHYKESLRRSPQQPDRESILVEMAESQIALSQFDDALQTLGKSKRSAASLTLESSCLRGLGQLDQSIERIRDALELDPRFFSAWLMRGTLFLDSEDLEQAVAATKQAIEINSHSSKAHHQLSQALRELGRVEEADVELKTTSEIQAVEREFSDLHDVAAKHPTDAAIRHRIGDAARRLGKLELARMWFRAALAINPNHLQAQVDLRELGNVAVNDKRE